jgi:uncharacterized protein YdcH (DUF465 family)
MQHQAINTDAMVDLDKLMAEHRALDMRVGELEQRVHLSPDEELEIHQLKKLKLHKKDCIQGMRAQRSS